MRAADEAMGPDRFAVLTIGFDARADTPDRMRVFTRERGIELAIRRFVRADAGTIDRPSRDIGFTFLRTAEGFDHLTQTSVVDPDGLVYRQIYVQR